MTKIVPTAQGLTNIAAKNRELLEKYYLHSQPYHEPAPGRK
jgi:hypothetical protein